MLHKALFEESEQSYAYGKHNPAALQEGGFYATRKIKLKNKYKRNSASGEGDFVCRRVSIAHFFL